MSKDTIDDTTVRPSRKSPGYQTKVDDKWGGPQLVRDDSPTTFAQSLDQLIIEENEQNFVDEDGQVVSTPENSGSQAVSGHMPDPESDDDVTAAAHQVGLHLDESYEEPHELDIGAEINDAEKAHRES